MRISLQAVIVAVSAESPRVLMVTTGDRPALPSGPLAENAKLEESVRRWVVEQTELEVGWVEQLYTFGDPDRSSADRELSIAYLALADEVPTSGGSAWMDWYSFFPWEDHRAEQPEELVSIRERLMAWSVGHPDRIDRVSIAFGLEPARWDPVRVLDRYELLYEAELVAEFHHDRGRPVPEGLGTGQASAADHRRIAAVALSRLRGKLTYRPVVFELLAPEFTLRQLQDVVEALAGTELHTQNFRRLVERGGLVEETGRLAQTGGRPARLYRFRREVLRERSRIGVI